MVGEEFDDPENDSGDGAARGDGRDHNRADSPLPLLAPSSFCLDSLNKVYATFKLASAAVSNDLGFFQAFDLDLSEAQTGSFVREWKNKSWKKLAERCLRRRCGCGGRHR